MVYTEGARTVQMNDVVRVHYSGRTDDGEEFETTFDEQPFEICIGETKIIKGFENALLGMEENETIDVNIPCSEAYGEYKTSLIAVLRKSEFPPNSIPAVGWRMKIGPIPVLVKDMDETTVTLDGNHPLAGQDLDFRIKVVEIL